MSDVPQDLRNQAAILARRKSARSVQFTREAPCDWRPQTVIDLETDAPFTPDGAWEFVAIKLQDEDQVVRWIELKKPPGKKALEMIVTQDDGDVYIKVQLGAGKIKGRSFHYSTRTKHQET